MPGQAGSSPPPPAVAAAAAPGPPAPGAAASGNVAAGATPFLAEMSVSSADCAAIFRDEGRYEELGLIGNGAYGTVYRARDLSQDGQLVALKKVAVPLKEDGLPMSTLREIALLKQLDRYEHPNIVRLLDVCHGQRMDMEQKLVLFLVFEHIDQDLSSYLERVPPPGMPPARIKDIIFQIICGVDFLHTHRIVHRDLKPQNVLISSTGVVKLADFGLAKSYDFEMRLTSVVVTLWYRAPEVLLLQTYATPVDIWSCGCMFAELFRKRPLFMGKSEPNQLDQIFQITGTPTEEDWPESSPLPWSSFVPRPPSKLAVCVPTCCSMGVDLMERMLKLNPAERISASNALDHAYFVSDGYVRPHVGPSIPIPPSSRATPQSTSGHSF